MEYDKLKKILCTEIDDTIDTIMKDGKMSIGDLDIIDKLTHSLKSVITTKAMEESKYSYGGYSEARGRSSMGRYGDEGYSNRYYDDGYSGRRSYNEGYSGRRYSRDDGKSYMIQQFEKLMESASSQEEHEVLQSAINRLKNM